MQHRAAALIGAATLAAGIVTTPAVAAATPAAQQWPLDAAHFNAARLWTLSEGAGITVAVVDTGVDASHPDLADQVLPGIDLTGRAVNGRVDRSPDAHGTSVAAVIAGSGRGPTGRAVVGLAPKARILPVRIADRDTTSPALLAQGIAYAAEHRAQVINVSTGTPIDNPQIRAAVAEAHQRGAIVIAASGNEGRTGNPTTYPAALPGVVAVAGTDRGGAFWPQSGTGDYVSLAAPATAIYSADNQGGYLTANGTSYAAPYVSAAAALLRAKYPDEGADLIVRRLLGSADPVPGARSDQVGHGLLDPYAALSPVGAPPVAAIPRAQPASFPTALVSTVVAVAVLAGAGVVLLLLRRRRRRAAVSAPPVRAPRTGSARSPRPAARRKAR